MPQSCCSDDRVSPGRSAAGERPGAPGGRRTRRAAGTILKRSGGSSMIDSPSMPVATAALGADLELGALPFEPAFEPPDLSEPPGATAASRPERRRRSARPRSRAVPCPCAAWSRWRRSGRARRRCSRRAAAGPSAARLRRAPGSAGRRAWPAARAARAASSRPSRAWRRGRRPTERSPRRSRARRC